MGSPVNFATVLEAGARAFSISVDELVGPGRTYPLASYRQATMLAVRRVTGASYPTIGRLFGDRHHATAQAGCRRADPELVAAVVDAIAYAPLTKPWREVFAELRAEVDELWTLLEAKGGTRPAPVSPTQLALVVGG